MIKFEACRAFIIFSQRDNTGARMLDSIYHMTLKLSNNHIFGVKNVKIESYLRDDIMDIFT